MGASKGDTRSLDYGSCEYVGSLVGGQGLRSKDLRLGDGAET